MANYNNKIEEISKNVLKEFKTLLIYTKELTRDRETHDNKDRVGIPIKPNEANKINLLTNTIRKLINDFEYYTKFYPDKESIWKKQIEQIEYIKHIIEQITIEK